MHVNGRKPMAEICTGYAMEASHQPALRITSQHVIQAKIWTQVRNIQVSDFVVWRIGQSQDQSQDSQKQEQIQAARNPDADSADNEFSFKEAVQFVTDPDLCLFCLEGYHELDQCWAYMKIRNMSRSIEARLEAIEAWLVIIKL